MGPPHTKHPPRPGTGEFPRPPPSTAHGLRSASCQPFARHTRPPRPRPRRLVPFQSVRSRRPHAVQRRREVAVLFSGGHVITPPVPGRARGTRFRSGSKQFTSGNEPSAVQVMTIVSWVCFPRISWTDCVKMKLTTTLIVSDYSLTKELQTHDCENQIILARRQKGCSRWWTAGIVAECSILPIDIWKRVLQQRILYPNGSVSN